ncbi:MAG: adenosylcobalamin-dependent ribonucleoside-diphosphate reductase [Planctomycetota bacterium]|jgi:ribonucleoside-diphosphate reductase alpha chain|nr:adenosylcobalamin-dependent ribonucleoside-diphosphate reductase [Planctomycetota bacterium]
MDGRAWLESVNPPSDLPEPDFTDNANTVLRRRYLKKNPETGQVCETPAQLLWRVATHIGKGELAFDGGGAAGGIGTTPGIAGASKAKSLQTYSDEACERAFEVSREFYEMMGQRLFMPNSPTLMNAGREMGMLSACFVLPVEDSIEGIFDSIKATAMIQKAGGGTGFSFSRLRPRGDLVRSSGGTTEGPMSFIQVFSKATDAIQQGAFRRGANMGILRVDHPDLVDFITYKDTPGQLTNYNVSVAVTDRFIQDLRTDRDRVHEVMNPRTKEWAKLSKRDEDGNTTDDCWTVGELWDMVIEHAHRSGEPGMVFIDRINARNPIQNVGIIEATNPCGEQPLHAYDSCNLGSINLGAMVSQTETGSGSTASFDWEGYKSLIHTSMRFLDNVIEVNKYPLPQIDNMSRTTRRVGLGVMGFADALYKMGLAYNTEEGCAFGEEVMRVLNDESHLASEQLAEERGVFPAWEGSAWEAAGRKMRNSYTTTVAPTGTISIIANCSGGIEPMFSLAFTRQVMKDAKGEPTTMREVNYVFEQEAKSDGWFSDELVDRIIEEGSVRGMDAVPAEAQNIYVTARDITPSWHMKMQAAFQRHCDSSISKTINFPNEATVAEVREIYEMAIDSEVKGVTVYRDGCRDMQPMALKGSNHDKTAEPEGKDMEVSFSTAGTEMELNPVKLPEIMSCLRIRQMTPFGNMHVKVTVDPMSGREREVFAQLGKGGDVANSDLEAICRIISLWLRSNGSLQRAIKQLSGIGSSLTVPTKDGRIMSLADGLATALNRYLVAKEDMGLFGLLLGGAKPDMSETGFHQQPTAVKEAMEPATPMSAKPNGNGVNKGYKVKCPSCSGALAFEEGCVKCYGCGFSQC